MSCSGDSASPSRAVTAACISAVSALVAVPLATRPAMAASPLAPAGAAFPFNTCMSAFTSMSVRPPPPLSGCGRSCSGSGACPSPAAASTLLLSQSRTRLMSLPSRGASFAGTVWWSSCSRLLASFESNPEKPPLPSPSDPPFRPALRDRSAVASPAAIGCDTAPVFIACLPRSRSRLPVRLPCALASAPGLYPRLPD